MLIGPKGEFQESPAPEDILIEESSWKLTEELSTPVKLPIVAIGMGEKDTDLYPFSSNNFSKILVNNRWK